LRLRVRPTRSAELSHINRSILLYEFSYYLRKQQSKSTRSGHRTFGKDLTSHALLRSTVPNAS
jgi:hypothetical protein